MEVGDRFGEREAEPGAFIRPAGVEPAEAPPRLVAALGRNARTAVGDLDPDVPLAGLDARRGSRRRAAP